MTPEQLRSVRAMAGWTADQLAAAVGASKSDVEQWESAQIPVPEDVSVELLPLMDDLEVIQELDRREHSAGITRCQRFDIDYDLSWKGVFLHQWHKLACARCRNRNALFYRIKAERKRARKT